MNTEIRRVSDADVEPLTRLWHAGWVEAHAAHVPADFLRLRSFASFEERLRAFGDTARTAGDPGQPLGLCVVDGDELDQLYVAPKARGGGLAARLLTDGEARIKADGFDEARLLCLPENERAARFYTRHGWISRGVSDEFLETSDGPYLLPALVFTKAM